MAYIKHAIICAAGLGSRLGLNKTKSLIKVNHKKIIDYQLELLRDVPDVRIVVGFQSEKVIAHVRKTRKHVTFINNYYYKTTSSSYSAYLGTQNLSDPFLLLAGDVLIEPNSFSGFLKTCKSNQSLIGITKAKSQHPIFVDLDQNKKVVGLQRNSNTGFEWPCISFLNGVTIKKQNKYIFENLIVELPIKSYPINCYEIDTKTDLELARKNHDHRIFSFVSSRDIPV
ncbi:NTP transferase domain-containing protein [Candidatus Dependentiae bacterium]|nr:NTP transferase domain-containing protein [Candidatus Dependentiae bacterium]